MVDTALHDPWGVAINRCNLVVALLHWQGPGRAHEELQKMAADAVALGDVDLSIDVIETCAANWAGLGNPERAATLLGTADRQRELAGIPRAAPDQAHLDRFIEPASRSVPDQVWRQACQRGASLSIQEAVAEGSSHRSVTVQVPT